MPVIFINRKRKKFKSGTAVQMLCILIHLVVYKFTHTCRPILHLELPKNRYVTGSLRANLGPKQKCLTLTISKKR